jgi:hypothetical protein
VFYFRNPYVDSDFEEDEDDDEPIKPMKIDIDLALSAYANSRKYVVKVKRKYCKLQPLQRGPL